MNISKLQSIFVGDATPLMKVESTPQGYGFYKKVFSKLFLPEEIIDELRRGSDISRDEYLKLYDIEDFVTIVDGYINPELKRITEIDKGEAEAISIAHRDGLPLLIEERKGRAVAKENGVMFTGNGGLVLYAYRLHLITQKEAVQQLNDLRQANCFNANLHGLLLEGLK